MEIGVKIRKMRELRNLTQDFMAKGLGITQETYSRLETGQTKINMKRIEDIAKILDVDPLKLMNFDENFVFNNCSQNQAGKIVNNYTTLATEERNFYLERISTLEKEIQQLKKSKV